jgi:hypothetical protein
MAARIATGGCVAAAAALSYSRSQTQRRWNEVKDLALIPLGLPRHDDVLAAIWILAHRACCTSTTFLLLENDSRFNGRTA